MDKAKNAETLQWWLESGLELKYSEEAMKGASEKGKTEILQWWKESGLELKYTKRIVDEAKNVEGLEWWKNSGLKLLYTEEALFDASMNEKYKILDWWK